MHQVNVSADELSHMCKPWSNERTSSGTSLSLSDFDVVRDLGCPVAELFSAFLTDRPTNAKLVACPSLSCDPLSFCKAVLIPVGSCSQNASLDLFTKIFTSDRPWTYSDLHPASPTTAENPQFEEAASISAGTADRLAITTDFQFVSCPAGDTGAARSDSAASSSDANAAAPASNRAESPIRLPLFAQQMMVNLPREFVTNPVRIVQGLLVRTWYLHHVNIPRSLQARQVMLTGPPHLWRAQILVLWSDLLIPALSIGY